MTHTSEPTVFLLDDDPAVRHMMAELTRSMQMPLEIVKSSTDFLANFDPHQPGCFVLDVLMLGLSGLEFLTKLHHGGVFFAAIAVSSKPTVSMAVHAMRAGAINFLQKPLDEQQLWNSLQEATRRDADYRRQQNQMERIRRRMQKLTVGESDVLKCILAGKLNREIAESLAISVRTVEVRRAKVMDKMKASSMPEMIRDVTQLEIFSENRPK